MAELKTKKTKQTPAAFLKTIKNEQQVKDSKQLLKIFKEVTGKTPKMWGNMVGYGDYHYKYASGREGDWFMTGFSPRKQSMTVYIMPGFKKYPTLMKKLGKYKTSVSCLYFKTLDDLHIPTLKQLIKKSVADMKKTYDCK